MIFHTYGKKENKAIVLIHGVLTPWQIWNTAIRKFKRNYYVIVPELDAVQTAKKNGISEPLVMIHGDDVTHLVTEVGVAYLYMAKNKEERKELIAAVAGKTALGLSMSEERRAKLRKEGKVAFPEDLGIDPATATRDRLAAQDLNDIVEWSHGLYKIPAKFLAE